MKSQNIAVFRILMFVGAFLVGVNPFLKARAEESFNGKLRPHIGLKSEEVVRNELKQMGLSATEIILLGDAAKARISVQGEAADIKINRQTGTVEITKASPTARQLIESRVPKIQLFTKPNLLIPSKPVKSYPEDMPR